MPPGNWLNNCKRFFESARAGNLDSNTLHAALLYELEQDPDCVHWQAADLSHLGEIEPFKWGEAGEPPLEKLRYIEGQGWVNR